jgi:hypothetical protein
MELKLDVKTLVIGIVIGVAVTAIIGAGSADKADFGVAIGDKGAALVRTSNGSLYIVNTNNGMATRVLYASVKADPDDRRDSKGQPFSLGSSKPVKNPY